MSLLKNFPSPFPYRLLQHFNSPTFTQAFHPRSEWSRKTTKSDQGKEKPFHVPP